MPASGNRRCPTPELLRCNAKVIRRSDQASDDRWGRSEQTSSASVAARSSKARCTSVTMQTSIGVISRRRSYRASVIPGGGHSGRRSFRASIVPGVDRSRRRSFQALVVPGVGRSRRWSFQALVVPGVGRSRRWSFQALVVPGVKCQKRWTSGRGS